MPDADEILNLDAPLHLRLESTAEQVAGAVRELILSARLTPGSHLREGPLATQLGVSRNTVREAVQILVSQGLVRREIHRGAYVARLTVDDVRDVFRVRRLVELTAAREVARSRDMGFLGNAVQALSAVIDAGDRAAIAAADMRFHKELVDLMRSDRLGELYAGVDVEMRLCIALVAPAGPEPSRLLEDHRAILVALEAGDASLATERLERHLDESERLLIAAFETGPA
jgi:DNA-binding GntR family transcriptional regulator